MNATSARKIEEFNKALNQVQTHTSPANKIIGSLTGERVGPMAMALSEDMAQALSIAQETILCLVENIADTEYETKYLALHKEHKKLQERFERMEANSVAWSEMAEHHKEVIQEKNQALWDIVLMARQEAQEPSHATWEGFCYAMQHKAEQACGQTYEQKCKEAMMATFASEETKS